MRNVVVSIVQVSAILLAIGLSAYLAVSTVSVAIAAWGTLGWLTIFAIEAGWVIVWIAQGTLLRR